MRTVHRQARILHLATSQSSQEDDHDKRQPSTITFTHQGVRVKDRGEFIVEKDAF
jgi:hypothetical protein